jgi:hypothetical protein
MNELSFIIEALSNTYPDPSQTFSGKKGNPALKAQENAGA